MFTAIQENNFPELESLLKAGERPAEACFDLAILMPFPSLKLLCQYCSDESNAYVQNHLTARVLDVFSAAFPQWNDETLLKMISVDVTLFQHLAVNTVISETVFNKLQFGVALRFKSSLLKTLQLSTSASFVSATIAGVASDYRFIGELWDVAHTSNLLMHALLTMKASMVPGCAMETVRAYFASLSDDKLREYHDAFAGDDNSRWRVITVTAIMKERANKNYQINATTSEEELKRLLSIAIAGSDVNLFKRILDRNGIWMRDILTALFGAGKVHIEMLVLVCLSKPIGCNDYVEVFPYTTAAFVEAKLKFSDNAITKIARIDCIQLKHLPTETPIPDAAFTHVFEKGFDEGKYLMFRFTESVNAFILGCRDHGLLISALEAAPRENLCTYWHAAKDNNNQTLLKALFLMKGSIMPDTFHNQREIANTYFNTLSLVELKEFYKVFTANESEWRMNAIAEIIINQAVSTAQPTTTLVDLNLTLQAVENIASHKAVLEKVNAYEEVQLMIACYTAALEKYPFLAAEIERLKAMEF